METVSLVLQLSCKRNSPYLLRKAELELCRTAYVMCAMNATHEDAFNHVQSRRFCASPNTNFKRQIEAYESINQAMVAMAQHANANPGQQDGTNVRRKRDLEEEEDGMQSSIGNRKRRDLADSEDEEGMQDDEMCVCKTR